MGKATYLLEVKIGASTNASYQKNINRAANSLDGLETTARRVAAGVATAFAAVNVSQLIEDAVGTYSEFEQAMRNTAAIADASVSEYEMMEQAAREAGRGTTMTATEAAEALGYMALAGWDAKESVEGLMPVLKLAEATGAELQETSDLVTDSMGALSLSVEEMDTYLDKLVAGNNNANNTAIELMESLAKTGGAANVLGASLDDTITAVGILAGNNVKGAAAGRAMNAILTRLASNSSAQEALEQLGVSIFDAEGNFIGLKQSLVEIDAALSSLSTEKSSAYLAKIAGTNRYSQMENLLAGVREGADGAASAWDELESSIENSEGALEKMNAQATNTLTASWERLKSAVDDTKISVVDVFGDDAISLLDRISERIPEITDEVTDFVSNNKVKIYDALETGGELLENTWNIAEASATWLLENKGAVVGALDAIGTALLLKKGANALNSIATFLTSITTPMGVIAGLSAAVGVIAGVGTAIRQAYENAAYANLDEHFGSITLSLEELQEIADEIVQGDDLNAIAEMLESVGESESALDDVNDVLKDIKKNSWKIHAGFTFDEQDSESYAAQIDDFVQQTQEYIDARGYEINIATTLLFGNGSTQSLESSAFFQGLEEEAARLGTTINEIIADALEDDSIIDSAEDKMIQEQMEKLNNITNAISGAQAEAKMQAIQLKYNGVQLDKESFLQLEEEIGKSVEESDEAYLEAYESAMSMYNAKKASDASYTDEEYEQDRAAAELAYYEKKAEAEAAGFGYIMDSIYSAYPQLESEMERARNSMSEILEQSFSEGDLTKVFNWDAITWSSVMATDDEDVRKGLEALYEQVEPYKVMLEETAQQCREAGEQIPESIAEALQVVDMLGTIAGDGDAILDVLGDAIGSNEEYRSIIEQAEELGAYIPEYISDGIFENETDITSSVDDIYVRTKQYLEQVFSKGFDVDANININYTTTQTLPSIYDNLGTYTNPVTPHAVGGIFTTPHYGLLAEEGPEAYIPLDGSKNAVSIWEKAGELLGVGQTKDEALYMGIMGSTGQQSENTAAGVNIQITYNPSIVIKGSASENDVREAVALGAEDVINIVKDYIDGQARVSFRKR